jgi:outer membrane receptor protein involved in Fe transport
MESLSWEHIFSPNLVSHLAAFQRYNSARLRSNLLATPVFAEQSRHQSNYGALGSFTYHFNRHTIKAGGELERFPVAESFTFAITDLDALLEKEPDLTEEAQEFTLATPFLFRQHRAGWEGSLYVQDHINATRDLTLDLGVRFDSYHFLVTQNYVSPRLGLAYRFDKSKTVLRAAYNRFVETPALENLLLSSAAESRLFSPASEEEDAATGAPVRPSREWQLDVGFQQQLGRYLRLDSTVYYRRLQNPPEITNFLETGIIFPATLARSRSKGVETRLDLAPARGLSGFVSYTNLRIYGFAPITGGLFLGEAVDSLARAGQRVKIEEDQRNTVVFEARYDRLPGRMWLAFSGRHDSGFSVELDPDVTREEFENEFPEKILDRVNFERGFIKPHTTLNLAVGKSFAINDHVTLSGQFQIQNLADNFHLITFESVFSGTTIGRPRSFGGRLSFTFK